MSCHRTEGCALDVPDHDVCVDWNGDVLDPYAWIPEAKGTWLEAAKEVLDHGVRKVDGVLLDAFTASLLTGIYEKLSPENRARYLKMGEDRGIVWIVNFSWELRKRAEAKA